MITKICSWIYRDRFKAFDRIAEQPEAVQREALQKLLDMAKDTEWGTNHHFEEIKSYEEYVARTPLTDYEILKNDIDRMRHGEKDILWKGRVKWYAKSSGTTNDKSKFIPVSKQALKDTHYKGGIDTVLTYMRNYPKSKVMDRFGLILGGSHQPNYNVPGSYVGDLSAVLIQNIPDILNMFRVPSKKTALLDDFEVKRDRIAREALHRNISSISGVPSWMMSVLNRVLEISGKDTIDQVWPHLEVFYHGGVAFAPYREQYHQLIANPDMHYEETYNASEGFFGIQSDPSDVAMLLMLDYGVFFEFIPLEEVGTEHPTVLPIWEVQENKNYALVISTSSGLWRYQIGDVIKFTSTRPYKFIITGRTKSFINAFGEELIVDNAEKGLQEACRKTGAIVQEYTAAPVFMDKEGQCRHQWVIEFKQPPADLNEFVTILDTALQRINSDYEAKRFKNLTLQELEIVPAREGLFNDWLKSKGKLGGQHKVPRLCNDRKIIEEILAMN